MNRKGQANQLIRTLVTQNNILKYQYNTNNLHQKYQVIRKIKLRSVVSS